MGNGEMEMIVSCSNWQPVLNDTVTWKIDTCPALLKTHPKKGQNPVGGHWTGHLRPGNEIRNLPEQNLTARKKSVEKLFSQKLQTFWHFTINTTYLWIISLQEIICLLLLCYNMADCERWPKYIFNKIRRIIGILQIKRKIYCSFP